MPPDFLVPTTFLGQPCGSGSALGVNPAMQARLQAAEAAVRAIYDQLAPEQQINPANGQPNATFAQWCAVTEPHICWRPKADHHSSGAAIDINATANPYIVTRNGNTPGGEAAARNLGDMRNRALAVYDRAMQFMVPPVAAADVSARQPNEPTLSVWNRFNLVSIALMNYLSFAIDSRPVVIGRPAIENADTVSDDDLLAIIPPSERLALGFAIAQLDEFLSSAEFQPSHPSWPNDSRTQYFRMLRDYEQVRIPFVIGTAVATPAKTRNPARGFLDLRSEIVVALCDQGLRWGACDFGVSANGDMMHFDLVDDGGFPQVNA